MAKGIRKPRASRRWLGSRRLVGVLALALLAACGGGGGDGGGGGQLETLPLPPGAGVTFARLFFLDPFEGAAAPTWGRMEIDPATLADRTGRVGGVLNVADGERWLVVNVPVPPPTEPPLAVHFDVGAPPDPEEGDFVLWCVWSERSLSTMAPQIVRWPASEYPRGIAEWDAQGVPPADLAPLVPGPPPPATAIDDVQLLGQETWARYQTVTNVQCAVDQCFPMAIANGLQFLEGEGVLVVPHNHAMGLKGDNTLVGQLDTACDRSATSRLVGNGVWFPPMLDGLFEYLDDNQLDGALDHRHQDRGYGVAAQDEPLPDGDFTRHGITSTDDGADIEWDWIVDRFLDGCALVAVYTWDRSGGGLGGHAVRITGVGVLAGRPWIRYSHDASQANDTSGLEDVLVWWQDLDNDGLVNFGGAGDELRFVMAECP